MLLHEAHCELDQELAHKMFTYKRYKRTNLSLQLKYLTLLRVSPRSENTEQTSIVLLYKFEILFKPGIPPFKL